MIYAISMLSRCIAAVVLTLALMASGNCAPDRHPQPASGIKGKVVLTGTCPGPERVGKPCPARPYQGALAIRRASDQQIVATANSDKFGDFKVVLPSGKYVITQPETTRYPLIHSPEIVVEKNKFTTVQIQGDLGMR